MEETPFAVPMQTYAATEEPKTKRKSRAEAAHEVHEAGKSMDLETKDEKDWLEFQAWKKAKLKDSEKENSKQDLLSAQYAEDSRMVKGIFRNFECPGGSCQFFYRKYKQDPIKQYAFQDGEQYTIPLAVARHINSNCVYYEHSNIVGPDGRPLLNHRGRATKRYGFESLDYFA